MQPIFIKEEMTDMDIRDNKNLPAYAAGGEDPEQDGGLYRPGAEESILSREVVVTDDEDLPQVPAVRRSLNPFAQRAAEAGETASEDTAPEAAAETPSGEEEDPIGSKIGAAGEEAVSETYSHGPGEAMKKKKRPWVLPLVILLLLVLTACGGFYAWGYFRAKETFVKGTKINGIDAESMTPAQVEGILAQTVNDYAMSVSFRDGQSETIRGSQVDYHFVPGDTVKKILEDQDPRFWFMGYFRDNVHTVPETTDFDHDLARKVVLALPELQTKNMTEPTDAYMVLEEKAFAIVPETEGNMMDPAPIADAVIAVLEKSGDGVRAEDVEGAYLHPAVYRDDKELTAEVERLNRLIGADITYIVPEGDEPMRLDGSTLKTWLSRDDKGRYFKDDEVWAKNIAVWVDRVSMNVNTVSDSRRFQATGIGTITVGGGDYGYSVNKYQEKLQLAKELEECKTVKREPVYFTREAGTANGGVGGSYIEADLTRQHVWIYKNGIMVLETDCVSGMPTAKRGTPTGLYQIMYKTTDVNLTGRIQLNGEPEYESHVNYWMPFYSNCGFHDADWRSSFGGNIYRTNGSHGCINLPVSVAPTFYSYVEEGMPVVIYYS